MILKTGILGVRVYGLGFRVPEPWFLKDPQEGFLFDRILFNKWHPLKREPVWYIPYYG